MRLRRLIPLAGLFLGALLIISAVVIFVERSRTQKLADNAISVWGGTLAMAVQEEDRPLLERFLRGFFPSEISLMRIENRERLLYSFPEDLPANQCVLEIRRKIERYSVPLGTLSACYTVPALARVTVTSPLFYGLLAALLVVCLFSATIPLMNYKKALLGTIAALEDLALRPFDDQGKKRNLLKVSQDPLTQRLVGLVASSIKQRMDHQKAKEKMVVAEELRNQARQVAHDIRSPLAALAILTQSARGLDESGRAAVTNAVKRIHEIANNLLYSTQSKQAELRSHLARALVEEILQEKRAQLAADSKIRLELLAFEKTSFAYIKVDGAEFKRVLSNLIQNAIEALDGQGQVTVKLGLERPFVYLAVEDNGRGIPAAVLDSVGQQGFSYGKEGGTGLGVHHAMVSVSQWRGTFDIKSVEGRGTTVTVFLPSVSAPKNGIERLKIPTHGDIVVLDDDATIQQMFRERLRGLLNGHTPQRVHCFSAVWELEDWIAENSQEAREALYLVDYDLGDVQTGLEVVRRYGLASKAVIVSGRAEDEVVASQCEALGVHLLPKCVAPVIPLDIG